MCLFWFGLSKLVHSGEGSINAHASPCVKLRSVATAGSRYNFQHYAARQRVIKFCEFVVAVLFSCGHCVCW